MKRVLESKQLVPGGGAVEAALSIFLESFAMTLVCRINSRSLIIHETVSLPVYQYAVRSLVQGSREQLAIAEFANALLVIPKTLAVNAAQDATELTARLRALHNTAQQQTQQAALRWSGLHFTLDISFKKCFTFFF